MTWRAFAVAAVLAACWVIGGCSRHADLPVYGQVSDFTLTSQSGAAFPSSALRGRVWVADFIYTSCPGPCPLMSERMRRIQDSTPPGVRLISFSVDPAHDTPAVLAEYGRRFNAHADRWTFLTGDEKTLARLDRDDFKLGTLDTSFNHSTRFVLVDGKGRIRGYYSFGDDQMVQHIARDAQALEKESS